MDQDSRLSTIQAYLVGLYGQGPHGLIWIGGHADGWKGRTFSDIDAAARYAVSLDDRGGIGVYHRGTTLARVPEKRGDAADSREVLFFALDIDIAGPGHKAENLPASLDDAWTLIEAAGFPAPTYWIHSGGGFYPQWRLAEPIDVTDPEMLAWVTNAFDMISAYFIATAGRLGWHLDNVRDLARVFRLPGTTNRKVEGAEVVCEAIDLSPERFDLGVLAALARPDRGIVHEAPDESLKTQHIASAIGAGQAGDDDLFDDPGRQFTREQAKKFVRDAAAKLGATEAGFNAAINTFAMVCAHFPWLVDRERCGKLMIKALSGVTGWTEPDRQDRLTIDSAYKATEAGKSWVATEVPATAALSRDEDGDDGTRLLIQSPADMAYWLAENAGRGRMGGFFLRHGDMVHTPRIDESGYVPAPEGGENGPAQIKPVSAPVLAAKLQYLYDCYKVVDVKDDAGKKTGQKTEVAALFPVESARRGVDAPEFLDGLRPLAGLTGTPMVRADGSLLAAPGYDEASGYLFLPEDGVSVPEVPEAPGAVEIEGARDVLLRMISDFPFASDDDRANYLGLLLTPLLRQVAPPSYKLFGIGAHQPGSGKTLLAEIASIIHGGVLRSEVPEDEPEWRKESIAILSTTSAPIVVLDNIMGVLKSSTLAGLLTAGREVTNRELGSNTKNITVTNDRVWVVTGNNLSIGGDLVRRTITVLIDPDTPNPEKRVDFAIPELRTWVIKNRNLVLWSLLTLIRAWVAAGMPEDERKQSDSFARWQRVVAGILAVAGVPGEFDKDSGQRAAAGGDDDELGSVLLTLHERFGSTPWRVAEILEPGAGDMVIESREWLPQVVLDRLSRSEPAGRKALGWWFRNRLGRWVTVDGTSLVLRESAKDAKKGTLWKVESR